MTFWLASGRMEVTFWLVLGELNAASTGAPSDDVTCAPLLSL